MVNLAPSVEQRQMVDAIEHALRGCEGKSHVLLWPILCDLGAPSIRLSESQGGWNAGVFDAVLAVETAGASGGLSLLAQNIAARTLLQDLGAPIESNARYALAVHDAATHPEQPVIGAGEAEQFLFRRGNELLLAGATGFSCGHAVGSVDLRRLVPVQLANGDAAIALHQAACAELRLLVDAGCVASAKRSLEEAAAYARDRVVFGKPIGVYQGVSHTLADAMTEIDGAGLLVWRATTHPADSKLLAQAHWWAARASLKALRAAMRVFGGYGMTEDSPLPRRFRTARDAMLSFGDPDNALDRPALSLPQVRAGEASITFAPPPDAEAIQQETRAFLREKFSAFDKGRFSQSSDNHIPELHRLLAGAGLLFPDWPAPWGRDCSVLATSAVRRTLGAAGWPLSVLLVTDMAGKLLIKFGGEDAKREILPRLAEGSALACLGMSEPTGGSDVFSAKTRAVRRENNWVVNGQKVFTTSAHIAHYVLLLTRSENPAGLTLFLAPLDRPGFACTPVSTFAGERTNITYYNDFEVEDRYLLGAAGRGQEVLAASLSLEHNLGDYYLAALESVRKDIDADLDTIVSLCGEHALDQSQARLDAHIALLEALSIRSLWAGLTGQSQRWYGPMCKLFGTEAWSAVAGDLLQRLAPWSLTRASPGFETLEAEARRGIPATIYGGTSEIQRSVIAETALGLPRSR